MAALMTSFIENAGKVSEYINVCRSMGIGIVAPDVNSGDVSFSVVDGKIGYALTAIKSVGRPVIEGLVEERKVGGPYKSLTDFINRMASRDLNKRAVENFIKAGAFDSLGGTRKQYMSAYVRIMDSANADKKNVISGQISLFDFASPETKEDFKESLPDVGEYSKEVMLQFEKEVLGIYVSGHPLEDFRNILQKNTSATAADFALDPETDTVKINDGERVTIGGMVTGKTIKYTKTNKMMAFINLEDLLGSVEVIVFPKDYEKYASLLKEDEKIFIEGRASVEEDKDAKLICERVKSFDDIPKKLWVQFPDMKAFEEGWQKLVGIIDTSEGRDHVLVYVAEENKRKDLGVQYGVSITAGLTEALSDAFGPDNIRVTN
jgi:DNA polymerase-3 subunit alpha